ncbi:phosphoesterase RecJ domain protein [mine drainage metagenome]|uniref:Phosphoesterase RecJ domain protein n=1 Tax=mine drainage metagenome TaxID=410659 RepID=T0ZYK8_9ZZZZ
MKAKKEFDDALKGIVDTIGIGKNIERIKHSRSKPELNTITHNMLEKLGSAGRDFVAAYLSGAPITVRFHNDGDGSTGAIGVYNALQKLGERHTVGDRSVRWVMHKGVTYDMDALYSDSIYFSNYTGALKPLVCIIDFGTTLDSNPAIKASVEKCDIVWLDHHPIPEGFAGLGLQDYINPINYSGSADYTGGYLACTFAEVISGMESEDIKEASLISDVSRYADQSNMEAMEYATVLDFLTGLKDYTKYLDGPITPKYLIKLLSDKEKLDSIYRYAKEILSDSIEMGLKYGKKYIREDGVSVNVVDFGKIADKYSGYLLPGRYSSRLQSSIEKDGGNGSITVVTFNNYISIRLSKHMAESIDMLGIIERLKEESEFVESGGGHREACSIKIYSEGKREVLELLLRELHAKGSSR